MKHKQQTNIFFQTVLVQLSDVTAPKKKKQTKNWSIRLPDSIILQATENCFHLQKTYVSVSFLKPNAYVSFYVTCSYVFALYNILYVISLSRKIPYIIWPGRSFFKRKSRFTYNGDTKIEIRL